ncbi:type III-B CRISPR module RAMP protein Cmr6 [Nocardiopsis lambiniae]|uniref:Type III-B CRISPR module RAMP protein Cmr6 n=1 Tax=Nocardiopsis lambiniae TaxID=3075539 RepID=A0ABU2M2Y6_9ACTN|nr:type III-B CRISPR module RAMP protein Cmr6 [Nocardiopsis sp. DSM 44743]MDT0326987.1 type III-B CRISPR module RAMP protein Cmr6 [Nocardiopsis sp. DSM 44743]
MADQRWGAGYDDPSEETVTLGAAHGPLGRTVHLRHVEVETKGRGTEATTTLRAGGKDVGGDANALMVLRRLSFEATGGRKKKWQAHRPLHDWAAVSQGGQHDKVLLNRVTERRQALLDRWCAPRPVPRSVQRRFPDAAGPSPRGCVLRLVLTCEWRLATGLGLQFGVLDSGMALHGTYGWPVIPAATLKGLAAAGARLAEAAPERMRELLGDPRPLQAPARTGPRGRGGVVFLDALPDTRTGLKVHSDTITPHQQPYYTDTMPGADPAGEPRPPGEHHAPVPVPFLSVSGRLCVDLLGTGPADLDTVRQWLDLAGEEVGGGGRTTAGYGYFTCKPAPAKKTGKEKRP